jgi:hypothetical protein
MASHLDLPQTALDHLARLVHLPRVQDLFVVACHLRQRLTMWLPAPTILSHRSLHLSRRRHSSHRLLPTRRSSPSNPSSRIASRIPTTVRMRARVAFHRLRLHHLLVWPVPLVRRPRVLFHLMVDVQGVHHQRCDLSSKTEPALPATGTRALTKPSIMLIPPLAVALQVVHLRQQQLSRQQRQQHGIGRIARPLHHRSVTGSGRRARSCRTMTRSARSSKSLTAAVLRLRTTCRRHRFRARVLRLLLMPDASMMATIPQRLPTTRPRWHPLEPLKRRHLCLACRRHQRLQRRLLDPNTTSQPLATSMLTKTTTMRLMSQRRMAQSLSATVLALHRPTAYHLRPLLSLSRSLRRSLLANSASSLRDFDP